MGRAVCKTARRRRPPCFPPYEQPTKQPVSTAVPSHGEKETVSAFAVPNSRAWSATMPLHVRYETGMQSGSESSSVSRSRFW